MRETNFIHGKHYNKLTVFWVLFIHGVTNLNNKLFIADVLFLRFGQAMNNPDTDLCLPIQAYQGLLCKNEVLHANVALNLPNPLSRCSIKFVFCIM